MKTFNWGALFQALAKAAHDLRANAPRPVPPTITGADLLADLDELEAALPAIKQWVAANPGAITAADDLLDFLEAEGFAWAGKLRAGVDAGPGGLAEAATWVARIRGFLSMIQPAPIGIPGAWSGARGHV